MGIADRKRTKDGGLLWVGVGFLATLSVGLVGVYAVYVAVNPNPAKMAIDATTRALAKRSVTNVSEEVKVEAFGDETYVVSGKCLHRGSLGVYVATCELVDGSWRVVRLELPMAKLDELNRQIDESFRKADRLLQEAGQ